MTTFNKKKVVNEFLCPNETHLHKAFWVIKNQKTLNFKVQDRIKSTILLEF